MGRQGRLQRTASCRSRQKAPRSQRLLAECTNPRCPLPPLPAPGLLSSPPSATPAAAAAALHSRPGAPPPPWVPVPSPRQCCPTPAFLPGASYSSSVSQQPPPLSTAPLGAGTVDTAAAPTLADVVVSAGAASCCVFAQQRVAAAGAVGARSLGVFPASVIAFSTAGASSYCSCSNVQPLWRLPVLQVVGALGSARERPVLQ